MTMQDNMKKYIIIEPEDGVFLGTTGRPEAAAVIDVPRTARVIALFSGNNIFDLTKAAAFFEKEHASEYMKAYIKRPGSAAFVAEVESNNTYPYVEVVDIVKAGYGEYVWDMIDCLPMSSEAIH